jgi:hypothetical protein
MFALSGPSHGYCAKVAAYRAALPLDVEPQRDRRESVPERRHSTGDRRDRKPGVGDQATAFVRRRDEGS